MNLSEGKSKNETVDNNKNNKGGKKQNLSDARLAEVLDIVCENIGPDWKELAQCLDLTHTEITAVARGSDPTVPAEQCWQALCTWRMKTPKASLIRDLSMALLKCRQKRVADLVQKLMESPQSIDDILSPHTDREDRMLEAMYVIVDTEASHWKNISKHLGLSDKDILSIQKKFGDRTREKCMHALYKWRHTVPLHEYKIANLVMALRASGLNNVAGLVKNLSGECQQYDTRPKKPDEMFIQIDVQEIDVESYTPTPNSTPRGDPTPRPKNSLPKEVLGRYVTNKVFFHFLDMLELQKDGIHPLVEYFHALNKSEISEINRKCSYIAVKVKDKNTQEKLTKIVKSEEMSKVLTDSLISHAIQREIGLAGVKLKAKLI